MSVKQTEQPTRLKVIVGTSALLLAALAAAVALTIWNVPLYRWVATKFDLAASVGLSEERLLLNYYELLKYLHLPQIKTLVLPDFPVSPSGAFHFMEVKQLFMLNYAVLFVAGTIGVRYLWRQKKQGLTYSLHRTLRVALIVPLLLTLVVAIGFDEFFVFFHDVLFRNDAWIFDPAVDPIIQVLPAEFFMACFVSAFAWLELLLLAGYIFTRPKIK